METMLLLFIGASLILAGILISPLSSRVGMPVLLIFLCVGMLAGEDGPGNIVFNDISAAFMVANLALAVILLDGGIRTQVGAFRVGLKPALLLATVGVVITAVITGLMAMWLLDLPLLVGLLIGAIISSTDASVVFSLLQGRNLNLNERVGSSLEIESGMNDPMAIFLTMLFIQLIENSSSNSLWLSLLLLVQQFGLGALLGLCGGIIMARLLERMVLVTAMYPLLVVSGGIFLFSTTSLLGGSGFLAIYLMGVLLANHGSRKMPAILQIHDGLTWLAQLTLFLLLGLLVTPSQLFDHLAVALLISATLILLARPLAVALSLLPFGFNLREHFFISWVGLRGAVPIVLALFPLMANLPDANTIFQITFVVVLISLILQGSTLAPLARMLKLEVPGRQEPKLRVSLDLPETGDHELLLFPLQGERWAKPVPVTDIHLPEPSRIVMYFREGRMYERRAGLNVRENDVIAVLAPRHQAGDVGQVLGWKEPPERLTDRRFFGEFTVNGSALLGDIQAMYGINVHSLDPGFTLTECF
ncbi:MAG: potassium/proton antiporter, partial [Pseudohongiellaceae bacterium]